MISVQKSQFIKVAVFVNFEILWLKNELFKEKTDTEKFTI